MLTDIVLISNNYGKSHDGIGSFAFSVFSHFSDYGCKVIVRTAETKQSRSLKRTLGTAMVSVIRRIAEEIGDKALNPKAVVLEYPFVECNPCIIFQVKKLAQVCKKNHVPLIVSLHEYSRANFFRKHIIREIVKNSDVLCATTQEILNCIENKPAITFLRDVPSNIKNDSPIDLATKDHFEFVFFGLINKAKAFDEMIQGWEIFFTKKNDPKLKLNIVSATKLDDDFVEKLAKFNVSYYFNLGEEEISKLLAKSSFGIVPIVPFIDGKNTTFKTMIDSLVLPIGKFDGTFLKENGFEVAKLDELLPEQFVFAFGKCYDLATSRFTDLVNANKSKAKKFGLDSVSKTYYENLSEAVSRYERN